MPQIKCDPILYFPIAKNVFEFKTGLRKLNTQSQARTEFIFQIDTQWPKYRAEKLNVRLENFDKYVCETSLNPNLARNLSAFIVDQLTCCYSQFFALEKLGDNLLFSSSLSSERFLFNHYYELLAVEYTNEEIIYSNLLDALICQLQEDISLSEFKNGQDSVSYLHLCFPNFWAAQDKIGKSFLSAHEPVPGMEKINSSSVNILKMLMNKGPFERFTWGVTSDTKLNHHPEGSQTIVDNKGRDWCDVAATAPLYLRIERQTTVPFTRHQAFLFTIRTYFREIDELSREEQECLAHSLRTMPAKVLNYKGLANGGKELVLNRLKMPNLH